MGRGGPPKGMNDASFRSNGINDLDRVFNGAVGFNGLRIRRLRRQVLAHQGSRQAMRGSSAFIGGRLLERNVSAFFGVFSLRLRVSASKCRLRCFGDLDL